MDDSQVKSVDAITADIIRRLEAIAAVRDRALTDGRQIVRLSANAVRATHRGDDAEADRLLNDAHSRLAPLLTSLERFPDILWAGYVQDAMKEYAEARLTVALVRGQPLPNPSTLGISDPAYLNALAEAASELRRQVLDLLRADDIARAEQLLLAMDEIYAALMLVDFPDAVTGGLRRTVDALRAVLERTRSDMTIAARQHRLEQALRRSQAQLEVPPDPPAPRGTARPS
jgi:translin